MISEAAPDPTRGGGTGSKPSQVGTDRRLAMGMSVGNSSGGAVAGMNVVPLIDILLVLLIIFMVITPLTPKGMDTLVPQPNPNQQQQQQIDDKTVVVQVTKNGKVMINNEDSSWDRLG